MASKHDAKRASENHWVMQQNLARQKSSVGFVHKARKPKPAPAAKAPPADAAAPPPKAPSP